ncbi:MAG: hypothetical protein AAF337_10505 [Pseudomonadota bacterium]
MRIAVVAAVSVCLCGLSGTAQSASWDLVPQLSGFGDFETITQNNLGKPTFGGSGIPTNNMAIQTYDVGNNDFLTLGLTATPRFSSPAPTNDGAGTFFVQPGINNEGSTPGAQWNFSFFAGLFDSSGNPLNLDRTLAAFELQLQFDPDPGAATDISEFGAITNIGLQIASAPFNIQSQGSQNLLFASFQNGAPGLVDAPAFNMFDALATGEYSFILSASDAMGSGSTSITVNAVPIPGAAPLFLTALAAAGVYRRYNVKRS